MCPDNIQDILMEKKKVNLSSSYIYKTNYDSEITFEYEVVNNHASDVCEET